MSLFFPFVNFALPSPNYFLFFLLRVTYLSLTGGASCHRSVCQCIPLITGFRGACGTSGNALKGWDTLGSRECCSSAQKCLPGLCKSCMHDKSMLLRTAVWNPSWGCCTTSFSSYREASCWNIMENICCKGPKECQGVKYACTITLRCTRTACAGDLWAMKDMSPCGCVPCSRQGEPMQTHAWHSKLLPGQAALLLMRAES